MVWVEFVLSEVCEENMLMTLSWLLWCPLACRGITLIFAFIFTWRSPICVCLCAHMSPFFKQTQLYWLRAHPNDIIVT